MEMECHDLIFICHASFRSCRFYTSCNFFTLRNGGFFFSLFPFLLDFTWYAIINVSKAWMPITNLKRLLWNHCHGDGMSRLNIYLPRIVPFLQILHLCVVFFFLFWFFGFFLVFYATWYQEHAKSANAYSKYEVSWPNIFWHALCTSRRFYSCVFF